MNVISGPVVVSSYVIMYRVATVVYVPLGTPWTAMVIAVSVRNVASGHVNR